MCILEKGNKGRVKAKTQLLRIRNRRTKKSTPKKINRVQLPSGNGLLVSVRPSGTSEEGGRQWNF